jgi:hypothetical protein
MSALLSAAPVAAHAVAQQHSSATSNFMAINTDNYTPSIPSPPPQSSEKMPRNEEFPSGNRQRAQERQQRLENQMRQAMSNLGCSDIPTQDAIISYIGADMRARRGLQAQSRRLLTALRSKDLPDVEIARMVSDFRTAVEADKQRRTASEAALDGRIRYSQNSRLEAMLLLFGVIGESPLLSVMREASVPAPENRNAAPRERNSTSPRKPSTYDNPMQNIPAPDAPAPDATVPSAAAPDAPAPGETAPDSTPENTEQNGANATASETQDKEVQEKKEKRRKNREERSNKKERSTDERSAEETEKQNDETAN